MAKITRRTLKSKLLEFRNARMAKDELEKEIKNEQPALLAFLQEFDPENTGVIYTDKDPKGKGETAAFRQQSEAREQWVPEDIIDWLNEPGNEKLRKACMVRVFSFEKWEAEVAAGNISSSKAKSLKKMGSPGTPFVQFRKPTENSK